MSDKYKKPDIQKKILMIIAIIIVAIIPVSFLYSLIVLIIEPSNVFVVEKRKNI